MKPTLSIGIATYNEEANLGMLLHEIFHQKVNSVELTEILVISDGSTDKTDAIVQSFREVVRLIRTGGRQGAIHAKNIMIKETSSDILVMLDADILPENELFIEKLIEPIINNPSVGLTSAILLPSKPKTFTEKVLVWNHDWKQKLFSSIGDGNNLYTCFGPAQAFPKSLYKKISYPDNAPYDALSYMFCIANGLNFVSVKYPRAVFRCPTNLHDHARQSARFAAGKKAITDIFGEKANKAYTIPHKSLLFGVMRELLRKPIFSLYYFVMWFYVRAHKTNEFTSLWEIAESSKKLK